MFEIDAILLDIAMRGGKLLPADEAERSRALAAFPNLVAFRDRCFSRPAYRKAIADIGAPRRRRHEIRVACLTSG